MAKNFCYSFIFLFSFYSTFAQTSISGVVNIYTPVQLTDFCNNNVVVESSIGFASGDRVMLIQMSGAEIDLSETAAFGTITNYANTGNFEILTIESISFNIITFTETMERFYDVFSGRVQLVRIPVYTDVDIDGLVTAPVWDGEVGGVVAIIATGNVTFNNHIDVSNLGFKGGDDYSHTFCWSGTGNYSGYQCSEVEYCGSRKGESIGVEIPDSLGRGAPANGGGGGNDSNTGGGGGANFGSGGLGGERLNVPAGDCGGSYPGEGGHALLHSIANNQIFMGGGGGSGDQNENDGTSGSPGGGIIFLQANTISGNGFAMKANGKPVYAIASKDGAGGGGGAGTIVLDVTSVSSALNIEVNGGDGGDVDNNFDGINCIGPGGGGGGGALWITNAALPVNVLFTGNGGPAGITLNPDAPALCNGSSNGATAGNAGGIITGVTLPIPTTIFIPLTLTLDPADDQVLCEGESLDILSVATGTGTLDLLWNTGSTNSTISADPISDFEYQLTVTDSRGCQITKSIFVEVIEKVEVLAYPDSVIVQGTFVTLFTSLDPSYDYSWTPTDANISDPNSFAPVVNPLSTTVYCVSVLDQNSGCLSEDCITIEVIADVAIPNVFTPNQDGLNDYFRIPNLGDLCESITLFKIYTRWGKEIYDYTADVSGIGWDGTDQISGEVMPIGTYIYLISLDCVVEQRVFSSDVILIR